MSLESQLLNQVRAAAQRDRTTVNAIVRELLTRYAQSRQQSSGHDLCQPERASWGSAAGNHSCLDTMTLAQHAAAVAVSAHA